MLILNVTNIIIEYENLSVTPRYRLMSSGPSLRHWSGQRDLKISLTSAWSSSASALTSAWASESVSASGWSVDHQNITSDTALRSWTGKVPCKSVLSPWGGIFNITGWNTNGWWYGVERVGAWYQSPYHLLAQRQWAAVTMCRELTRVPPHNIPTWISLFLSQLEKCSETEKYSFLLTGPEYMG